MITSVIDYTLPLDQLPDPLPIEPLSKPFDVTITPPGSKSITCRAYVLAALADGESKIIRPLRADDTEKLLAALCTLGAEARWEGDDVYIKGVNGRFPRGGEVNLGDGGAPTRFMIACACLAAEPVVVDGSKRMRERPIAEGVDMLRKLGARIEYVQEDSRLPVRVLPSEQLRGGKLEIGPTRSSQFISAVLLIASGMSEGVKFRSTAKLTSPSYIELTRGLLKLWHIRTTRLWRTITVRSQPIPAMRYEVEPDASSATPWWTAAALIDGCRAAIPGLAPVNFDLQPDADYADFLNSFGFWPTSCNDDEQNSVVVEGNAFGLPENLVQDMEDMPDASLSLAVLIAGKDGVATLTGLHTLRHKETDRIAALANELRRIGCTIETTDDSITIDPSTRHDEPVVIETYNDHRMAMSFAVLGLARPGISIKDPACVSKSYPTFWQDFAKLYQ